jgi:flagellar motility protein MotE (MotC chaperone)
MFFVFLLLSLGIAVFLSVLTLDFLDILTFRYKIPEKWRQKWPLAPYYDFVQLHQLPEEERYQQLMIKQQQRFEREIVQGNEDLKKRSEELENSYRALIRTQKERYNNSMKKLRAEQEKLLLESKELEAEKEKFKSKKQAVHELSQKLASEAASLQSSLIKFMEEGQRLEQVRRIATVMEPQPLANIFNEVADNKLIYDIISGLPPVHAARILGQMDVEKAGQIMRLGQEPMVLPEPGGPARTYIPPALANLVASSQALLND